MPDDSVDGPGPADDRPPPIPESIHARLSHRRALLEWTRTARLAAEGVREITARTSGDTDGVAFGAGLLEVHGARPVLSDVSNSPPRRTLTARQLRNKRHYERRKALAAEDRAVEDRAKAIARPLQDEIRDLQADKLRAENLLKKRTARYIESSAKAKARSAKLSRDKVSANKAKREAEDTAKKERKVSAAAKTTHKKLKVCQHVSLLLSLSFVF